MNDDRDVFSALWLAVVIVCVGAAVARLTHEQSCVFEPVTNAVYDLWPEVPQRGKLEAGNVGHR